MILKKSALITIALILAGIVFLITFFSIKDDDLESSIRKYEQGNYVSAIIALNNIKESPSYEDGEKIFYYRCRAINDLAEELENKYSKYLKAAIIEKRNTAGYTKARRKIEEKLSTINKKIGGDLQLAEATKLSRIVQGGKFYNEFLSNYRGSHFIEDLDFMEFKSAIKSEPEKLFQNAGKFYSHYPDSSYIPKIVSMIFESMHQGETVQAITDSKTGEMIINFAAKYPTSQEASRIYMSDGDNVNLRDSPGLTGNPAGKTIKDEVLIQLEKSMDTMQVGDTRDYWYRVATLRGVKGWIFGKFLKPLDPDLLNKESKEETWAMEDNFDSWSDSNTPENWMHVEGEKSFINFRKEGDKKILVLNASEGSKAGLFNRFTRPREFRLKIKARFVSGSPVVITAFSPGKNSTYILSLGNDSINLNGRIIPFNTANWHVYEIFSENQNFASLSIDGQIVSGRIPPIQDSHFSQQGTYLMNTEGEATVCELEFIKIR